MSRRSKKSGEKEKLEESGSTRVGDDPGEVNYEKNKTGKKSEVNHGGGDKNTGDNSSTSSNQGDKRPNTSPVKQGDYTADDDVKSTGDTEQEKETESKKSPRPSSQGNSDLQTTTEDVKDSGNLSDGTTDDNKDSQMERNTENGAGTTESSTDGKTTKPISDDDTGEISNADVPDIGSESECYESTEIPENTDNFSKETGLRDGQILAQTPEAKVKSKIFWKDKMKTQAVTVILAVYGVLILLLLYLVLNTPYSPIHVPPTNVEALEKISDLSQNFGALQMENSKLKSKIDSLEIEIQEKKDEIRKLYETVEKLQQMVDNLREKLPFLAGKMKWMEQEQTEQGNYILLLLVIFLLIFLGITYLVMRRKEAQHIVPGQVESFAQFYSKVGGKTHTSVLDQIRPKSLDKTIGIVSFNNKTQKFHKEMLQRALYSNDRNIEIVAVVVDRADKILTIHPSCLMFIFVDRNDRNIILEDPDSEIGDLRRLTTQGVMKMGCTVAVVYFNDKESRDLVGRDLYNPCLQSVKRHPVLKELQADGRVFSVMDNFNQNQNKHINQLLRRCGL